MEDVLNPDSATLVARFQAGDVDAFALLFTRYRGDVYAYLRAVFREHAAAEDGVQDVFGRAFAGMPIYESRAPFRVWLFKIARNYALDQRRRHSRWRPEHPARLDELRRETSDLKTVWMHEAPLAALFERLPLPQRQVLLLRFALDFETAEIAAVLGCSAGNVRQLQSRSLRFLRAQLRLVPDASAQPLPQAA